MRLSSLSLLLLFILAAAVAAPCRSHAAETFESGEADSVRRTAKGFTLNYSQGGDGWDVDVPRSSPAHARAWLAQWLVQRGNNTPFAYVWLVFNNKKLADLYAEALLETAEKRNDAYVLTCNFSGQGGLYPRRAELFISPANPLYEKAPEIIAAMKAADPRKQAVLVQFEKEMELLNYRIVDQQTAMSLPLEGANATPPDREQEAAMAAVGEFLKKYHAGYLVGKIGAKEFIAICDAEMAQKYTGKDPRHAARVLAARSQAYKDTGDMARAQADAEAAVAADAQNDDAHSALAQAYAGQGKYDKALESLEKAKAVTPVAQRKQRYEEQARAYRTVTSPQARALKGVWKVDPHKTLAGISDKKLRDHWQKKFKQHDTDSSILLLAFDPEEGLCKSARMTYHITGLSVQQDGRTIVVHCDNQKQGQFLTLDSDTELRRKITNDLYFHYKKFEEEPARFYKNWRIKGRGGSTGEMILFPLYDPPAWADKPGAPASETRPADPAPQSDAAPSGKSGGLARLNGVWHFDPEASVARYPKRETDLETASLVKISIDVSAKKLVVHTKHRDKPKESDLVVLFDDGNRVVIKNGERSDNVSFSIVNDDTIIVEEKDLGYVFTRKEPHADILARLNGEWSMDLAAMKERSPDFDLTGVEAGSMSVDAPGRTIGMTWRANGKSGNEPTKQFGVKSSESQFWVITIGYNEWRLEFLNDNALTMAPMAKPQNIFVFTRTIATPAGAQATTPAGTQTPATPADILPKLDGVWNLDVKASEEQSRNAPWGKLDEFSLSFDVQKKRFETTDAASGKRLFAGPFSLKTVGESVVLVRNAVETYCSFSDNDTLILSLVDEPQKRLVFTRAK